MRIFHFFCMVIVVSALGGCVSETKFTGALPPGSHLTMDGKLSLSPAGQLVLALDEPCRMTAQEDYFWNAKDICDAPHLEAIAVIATTPWGKAIRGTWVDASHIRFSVDWRRDGIDPRAPDAATLVARPWKMLGRTYSFSAART